MNFTNTVLACVAICSSTAYGQIVNGSFESNTFNYNDIKAVSELANTEVGISISGAAATGWALYGAGVAQFNSLAGTTDRYCAAALTQGSAISQDLTFSSAGTYQVSFDVYVDSGSTTTYSYGLDKGDSQIFSQSGTKTHTGNSATIIRNFTVDSTKPNAYQIVIENQNRANGILFVDNVSIQTVPEPSSAALLGLSGLALILRRRS